MDIYVARQPIFDREYNVVAYELLYRDSIVNSYNGSIADNVVTSMLIANAYLTFGIENLIGNNVAYINFDKRLINLGVADLLNKESVVIEILETVVPDAKFVNKLKSLKKNGYKLALDDYTTSYKYDNITSIVDLIKVDFKANTKDEIIGLVKKFKKVKKEILAEKVETQEEYHWAKELGFDYFQGYYFAKPLIKKRKGLNNNALQYIKLMNELSEEEPDFCKLTNIIKLDISLTYKLLKLVNANSIRVKPIQTIKQAITTLGIRAFEKWLSLAVIQSMIKIETIEITKCALARSNFLMNVAKYSIMAEYEDQLSLIGLLSILDIVLDMGMKEIMDSLPLEINIKNTLLGESSRYSEALKLCLSYEKGNFKDAVIAAKNIEYNLKNLQIHYVESLDWAEITFNELNKFR